MKTYCTTQLDILLDSGHGAFLGGGLKGLEKESLRIGKTGFIAQTPHPRALGSALTHPHITTDYSEALLEFITPPFKDLRDTLAFLHDIHQFFYDCSDEEMLLASSMPCGIDGDSSIPIAEYGTSNIGRMKHVYRRGLCYRYGRTMQAIAGIHFNYSVPVALWEQLHRQARSEKPLAEFIADGYFHLIRNFQRQGWLILYLFGASPAICRRFFKSRPHLMAQFENFDACTLYHPYATSLRMSDIGYKSKSQAGLTIDYNSLNGYVASLTQAIGTPYPDYETIGVKVDGEYRQLNANILQIENEFYSTVRPKQVAESGEKPTLALRRRGVSYLEIRSLDLDVFQPLGIDAHTGHFIEALLLTCMFQDGIASDISTRDINNANQLLVANQGRKPGLLLQKGDRQITLSDWAQEIIAAMQPICDVLDADDPERPYNAALRLQAQRIDNPDLTPSARVLADMGRRRCPFESLALQWTTRYRDLFKSQRLDAQKTAFFTDLAAQSLAEQQQIEAADRLSFDDFLNKYFAQKVDL
ncbi:MAG: glutamate--cysteine ligase [Gammaproteobacteria bacterium]